MKIYKDEKLHQLYHNSLPQFIVEANKLKTDIEVLCESCGKEVIFESGTYLGVDYCGMCPRMMMVPEFRGNFIIMKGHNCPEEFDNLFHQFTIWWRQADRRNS